MEAWYLAQGLAEIVLVLSPTIITLGGGVIHREYLCDRISQHLDDALGGYVEAPKIVRPHFGDRNGLMGAFALAEAAART
jgi:fructokinase